MLKIKVGFIDTVKPRNNGCPGTNNSYSLLADFIQARINHHETNMFLDLRRKISITLDPLSRGLLVCSFSECKFCHRQLFFLHKSLPLCILNIAVRNSWIQTKYICDNYWSFQKKTHISQNKPVSKTVLWNHKKYPKN